MLDLANPIWATAPKLLGLIVLTPLLVLTALTLVTALVALFGKEERCHRATKLFETNLDGLLWLLSALLRFTRLPKPPPHLKGSPLLRQGKNRNSRRRRR